MKHDAMHTDPTALAVDVLGEALNDPAAWAIYSPMRTEPLPAGEWPALDVPVGDRRPEGSPDRFVVVWSPGAQDVVEGGLVESPLLEVEAWARDSREAWRLASRALKALRAAAGTRRPVMLDNGEVRERTVRSVTRESGPGNLPPGEAGLDRFRLSVSVNLSTRS